MTSDFQKLFKGFFFDSGQSMIQINPSNT